MKIGVITDCEKVSKYNSDLLNWIKEQNNIELTLLIIQNSNFSTTKARIKFHGFKGSLRRISFRFLSKIDNYLASKFNKNLNFHKKNIFIKNKFINTIYVEPKVSKSGLVYRFQEDDIEKIKEFNLDLMIRMGSGILKGEVLKSSLFGIVSFHHADNKINRGGPACFWEVFKKIASTGFTIQVLTEELDGGKVLKIGNFHTQSTYSENAFNVFRKSNLHMQRLLSYIAKNKALPEIMDSVPYSNKLYKVPSIRQQLYYLKYLINFYFSKFYRRKILRKFNRWNVAFTFSDWKKAVLYRSITIQNPSNSFLADPFVIENEGKYFCFVENYSFIKKKANIAVYQLENNTAKYLGESLNEKFDLSYPFVFKYQDQFFMLPESSKNKDLRLYKSTNFPHKWELKRVIFNNINACDGTIFLYGQKWWLFINRDESDSLENNSELFAYYSENPVDAEWIEHPKNPLVVDSSSARMGGLLTDENNVYLVFQSQGFNLYGRSSKIYRIKELTETNFKREYICDVTPDFSENIIGTHHMNSFKNCTVFDYLKEDYLS
jgi:methionyl-tRNA formyltransferase